MLTGTVLLTHSKMGVSRYILLHRRTDSLNAKKSALRGQRVARHIGTRPNYNLESDIVSKRTVPIDTFVKKEKRMEMKITPIAYIRTDFPEKFGIPRQPGVVESLKGRIVFELEYRNPDMIRGLEEFSHLWLIWEFSENLDEEGKARWSPTVRPPRLGGNERLGVFATRSPFRPNPIGLSVVKIEKVEFNTSEGPVINVLGADMVDGTPIYDIKPYIPYADSIPDAKGGFTDNMEYKTLGVIWEIDKKGIPEDVCKSLEGILSNDPRPHYQNDPDRIYGMSYAGYEVKFKVTDETLTVLSVS